MPNIKREDIGGEEKGYEFPNYTNQELHELQSLIETKYNGFKKVTDYQQFLVDEKATNKYGAVIVTGYRLIRTRSGEFTPTCDYPSKYEIVQNKLKQLDRYNERREYGQKRRLEELETTFLKSPI